MTTRPRTAPLPLLSLTLTLTLFGCAEPQTATQTTTTSVRTTQTAKTTQVISLKVGMKGSEAIAQVGIPCSSDTIKKIDEGANTTLNYQGHSYVFSKGVLEAVR